ncbi:MAG TPA: hypothetical protein VJM09_05680 [Sphingobium sp.]|nr:hypothetical protein [Sphingobium sp.]
MKMLSSTSAGKLSAGNLKVEIDAEPNAASTSGDMCENYWPVNLYLLMPDRAVANAFKIGQPQHGQAAAAARKMKIQWTSKASSDLVRELAAGTIFILRLWHRRENRSFESDE